MKCNIQEKLFTLLRSVFVGGSLPKDYLSDCSTEDLHGLFKISKKHDIAHLIAFAIETNGLLDKSNDCFTFFSKELLTAVYRYEKINYEYNRICDAFESAKILFLPLKGSVLRQYYPECWMRTSCDIDILIHENDLEYAKNYLVNDYGYTCGMQSSHDISFFSANRTHIELHYDLVEDGRANASYSILQNVWKSSVLTESKAYQYDMTDEMFYFYHIAHMAKHFEEGGCGIRPFIDLWLLDNIEKNNENKRNELLKQGDLLKFSKVVRNLSKVWFNGADHNDATQQMEQYVLRGGVYGTSENRIAVQQQKKGGRIKYALSKIFIPYDTIKFHYPILQKHRWLTPIMEVRRWFKLVFCGHAKRSIRELKQNNSISNAEAENIQVFLKNIGL